MGKTLIIAVVLLAGCAALPQTILTSSQELSIVNYAREKHTNQLELTDNERVFVDNAFPNFTYYIMAYPYGQYNISWETPDGRTIKIYGTGDIHKLENAKVIVE